MHLEKNSPYHNIIEFDLEIFSYLYVCILSLQHCRISHLHSLFISIYYVWKNIFQSPEIYVLDHNIFMDQYTMLEYSIAPILIAILTLVFSLGGRPFIGTHKTCLQHTFMCESH